MRYSTLPFPIAKAMDVTNQVLFLIILASSTNGKLANADLHYIVSQLVDVGADQTGGGGRPYVLR